MAFFQNHHIIRMKGKGCVAQWLVWQPAWTACVCHFWDLWTSTASIWGFLSTEIRHISLHITHILPLSRSPHTQIWDNPLLSLHLIFSVLKQSTSCPSPTLSFLPASLRSTHCFQPVDIHCNSQDLFLNTCMSARKRIWCHVGVYMCYIHINVIILKIFSSISHFLRSIMLLMICSFITANIEYYHSNPS